jgi:periplasmic divalent cation tolerance protein
MPDATVVVLTTFASEEQAVPFVRTLLDLRLVACGTVLPPARSFYWWEGKLADEREVVVLLKTRRERLDGLKEAFERLHPYDTPELLALPVHAALAPYAAWIAAEATGEDAGAG